MVHIHKTLLKYVLTRDLKIVGFEFCKIFIYLENIPQNSSQECFANTILLISYTAQKVTQISFLKVFLKAHQYYYYNQWTLSLPIFVLETKYSVLKGVVRFWEVYIIKTLRLFTHSS
jgi:hypothetical protein